MRKKPLLATVMLVAALAGCTAAPPDPAADLLAPASQNVALRTQGLLAASLGSAKVESLRGALVTSEDLNAQLGHLVPHEGSEIPAGAMNVRRLRQVAETPDKAAHWVFDDSGDHVLYAFADLRAEDLAALTFTVSRTGGTPTAVAPTQDAEGLIRVTFPEPADDYQVRLSAREDGTLRLLRTISEDPLAFEIVADRDFSGWRAFRDFRITSEITLKDAKGAPLRGMTAQNFLVGLTLKNGLAEYPVPPRQQETTLEELQAGKYQLTTTIFGSIKGVNFTPSAYTLDLAIRNKPLVHEVEY